MPGSRKAGSGAPRSAESWTPADRDLARAGKQQTLQRRLLQRQARARGLELRHTAYGYALIDAERNRIDDRNNMTLADIEAWLAAHPK